MLVNEDRANVIKDLRAFSEHWHLNVAAEESRKVVAGDACRPFAGEERLTSGDRAVHAGDHRLTVDIGGALVLGLKLHRRCKVREGEVQRVDEHGEVRHSGRVGSNIKRSSWTAADRSELFVRHPLGNLADRLFGDAHMLWRVDHREHRLEDGTLPDLALSHRTLHLIVTPLRECVPLRHAVHRVRGGGIIIADSPRSVRGSSRAKGER